MKPLDYALKYAALGWYVFPCHTIVRGACSCKRSDCKQTGKHPLASLVPNGHNGASLDDATIRQWWGVHPDANIGIATGLKSGIVVIDIDDPEAIPANAIVDSVEQITGSGGRHIIYKRPDDDFQYITNTKTGGIEGVDSRADGGYIIAPPSLHKSGRRYEWEASGDPLDGAELADAPGWWIDLIRQKKQVSNAIEKPKNDDNLPDDIADILSAIPSADYQTWITVGMALNYSAQDIGLPWWGWWSSSAENYDAKAVEREWRNFSAKKFLTKNPVTIETIYKLADMNGYIDPRIGEGEAIIASLEAGKQAKIQARIAEVVENSDIKTPAHLLSPSGILGKITHWVGVTSQKSQPQFDVQAALVFCSTVLGRRYKTDNNNFASLFFLNIGKSASGKEHAKYAVEKLLEECELSHLIGSAGYTSAAGVLSQLHLKPTHLGVIDEFGKLLESASLQNNSMAKEALTMLMEVWGRCDGTVRPKGYSTAGMSKKDIENMQSREVKRPALCLLAMTTPETFFDSVGSKSARDGFLNRFIIVESDLGRQKSRRTKSEGVPPEIIQWAEYYSGSLNLITTTTTDPTMPDEPGVIPFSDNAYALFDVFEDECIKLMDEHEKGGLSEMFGRTREQAMRISLICALSEGCSEVLASHAKWAIDYVRFYALKTVKRLSECVSDSDFQAIKKQVLTVIKRAGARGCTARDLGKESRRFDSVDHRQQTLVLQSLKSSGSIDLVDISARRKAWCTLKFIDED